MEQVVPRMSFCVSEWIYLSRTMMSPKLFISSFHPLLPNRLFIRDDYVLYTLDNTCAKLPDDRLSSSTNKQNNFHVYNISTDLNELRGLRGLINSLELKNHGAAFSVNQIRKRSKK